MSSTLYTMELENCNCLSSRNNCIWSSYERIGNDPIVCANEFMARIKISSLKKLWKKIKKAKKRRIFRRSSPVFLYDPCSYLQNFDDGCYSIDPDNFSRSFSARFAGPPSKIFQKNIEVMDGEEIVEINDES
ncbi:hypothetical protein MtrunA17_Chr4g0004431 [Medicago truncatula]|uniref:Uncharacterized protein n=1 Tax=Medicago truncatula TaxID=3880 RepID=A0A396HZ59_MEDTR|nr:hypothetical protein MtrunA17_Chr4g0004431 [Medicago truncatula]